MMVFIAFAFSFVFVSIFAIGGGAAIAQVHPLLGLFVMIVVYYVFFFSNLQEHLKWKGLPTFDKYLALHPESKRGAGVSCYHCNSTSIRNWGVRNAGDFRRIHICNHCSTKLYRSGLY